MKKILTFLLILTVLMVLSSVVMGGQLSDFTSSGYKYTQKLNGNVIESDVTGLLSKSGYSGSVGAELTIKSLLVPSEHVDFSLSGVEWVTKELKRRGKTGEMALPAFKYGPALYRILTNEVGVVLEDGVGPEILKPILKGHDAALTAIMLNGKERGYAIQLTTSSDLNPFELCTIVSGLKGIRTCVPQFIDKSFDLISPKEKA